MEIHIENIGLLLPKKVPKHGKVSGIKSKVGAVRVIIPNENTTLSLNVSEPSEILVRNVTPDGKILGLSNFIGQNIFIIDQNSEDLETETGMKPFFDEDDEDDEDFDDAIKSLFKLCEKKNLDPNDMLRHLLEKDLGGGK